MKVGVDYSVTDRWKVGADMVAASGQVIFGNENGALPQVPGYAVFGLHTSYQIGKQLQIYGLVQNLFDQRYYTAGALFDTVCAAQHGALPDQSDEPRTREALRYLRGVAAHTVTRIKTSDGRETRRL